MEEGFDLIEGKLQLKKDAGGWRHYIKNGENDRDIHCGAYMEVKLTDDHLGGWLPGRYEAYLVNPVEAYLIIGEFSPTWELAQLTIPLGTMVRVKELRG